MLNRGEYKLVKAYNQMDIENHVNENIKEGWIPIGGVAVYLNSSHNVEIFYQAMVKNMSPTRVVGG